MTATVARAIRLVQRRLHLAGRDRGSVTIETAILVTALFLLILLAIAAGRTVLAANAVADAAHDAARAASLQTDPVAARREADRAAHQSLDGNGLQCVTVTTTTDTSGFAAPLGQPAQVSVQVSCTLSYSQLAALPGINATGLQIAVGVTAIVLANAAINVTVPAGLLAANLALVYLGNALLGDRRDFDLRIGLFFAFLVTTIIWLYDAYRRVPGRAAA